jgi:hypothetical protein
MLEMYTTKEEEEEEYVEEEEEDQGHLADHGKSSQLI